MGQQQLLLIVLGVIIVGIAVVVGINVFTASSINANKDAVISDLTTIAAMSQQYFRKPTAMGGGGNSFEDFAIPASLTSTANGSYTISTAGTATGIAFTGTGTEDDPATDAKVSVTMNVDPNEITGTVIASGS